ncbi:hypothetical protein LZP69_08305 [Shewanella sp. AS1]|uniref:ATP-grasp domain-containing protein n=1 Tax=Shewanella sp. AS1 TaxID=2907626 RepID=UPI001F233D99|nr:hypothetical protein [Shewanella sp. AS1]MCE9679175.1 hypothetical protein [Shewanella sp. AS1]
MLIAIHKRAGSFSERWIEYCKKNNLNYIEVNAYDNGIVKKLNGVDVFMWHHNNDDSRDTNFANELLFSLSLSGIKTFPNINTTWHFDDKVAQKYLLESIGAPLVPSYVFYTKKDAIEWIEDADFPLVFKLRGGSGSANVKLVRTKNEAEKLISKSFGRGFSQFDRMTHFKYRLGNFKSGKEGVSAVFKGLVRLFIGKNYSNSRPRDKGYIYFQEFLPGNEFDTRVIVIGDKAFAIKRSVRENDFRASGSGIISYERFDIDEKLINIAFEVSEKLNSQSLAYDFVYDQEGNPKIIEISYGFHVSSYDKCPGYWDSKMNWHEGFFNPQEFIISNIIKENHES